jgi:2-keto-3-deoxy-L-rhamnonate aldolase RhmA
VRTAADAARYLEAGYTFVAVGSDSALVAAGADAIVASVRQARSLTA